MYPNTKPANATVTLHIPAHILEKPKYKGCSPAEVIQLVWAECIAEACYHLGYSEASDTYRTFSKSKKAVAPKTSVEGDMDAAEMKALEEQLLGDD